MIMQMLCHLFETPGGGSPPGDPVTVDVGCDGFVKLGVLTSQRLIGELTP